MDISRLKKKNLTAWLPLGDDDTVQILCRHISQSEFDALDEAATDKKGVRDNALFRSALAQAVVKDWSGIDDDGAEFPPTPENIDYLMAESTSFRLLVMDAPLSMSKMLAAEKEALRKNLLTTSGQKATTPA